MFPLISVIIPVFNEREILPDSLKNLQHLMDEDIEIIFVDGGSEDGTQAYLKNNNYHLLIGSKSRGKQLDLGAQQARGKYLLFLHLDSYFLYSPKKAILNCLLKGKIGAFQLNFQTDNFLLKAIELGSNWRLKYRQIAFGDQGIFMTKEYYHDLGGFQSLPLMEDYDLSIRNKAMGEKIIIANQTIYTSDRRFRKKGTLRTFLKMQYCQYLFRQGCNLEKIIRVYYS